MYANITIIMVQWCNTTITVAEWNIFSSQCSSHAPVLCTRGVWFQTTLPQVGHPPTSKPLLIHNTTILLCFSRVKIYYKEKFFLQSAHLTSVSRLAYCTPIVVHVQSVSQQWLLLQNYNILPWQQHILLHTMLHKIMYLKAVLDFCFDGEGVSSLSKILILLGKVTGWEGLFLVSGLTGSCSLLDATPGLILLLACRKWVPESAVSRSMARLGGECWCSSPEDREEGLALGAGLGVAWKT
jgi:hypothetical protein